MSSRLIQVTNIPTNCQKDQLKALFSCIGRIEDIQLYPESETLSASVGSKVAYLKFERSEFASIALHLTNTVFIEKPLICTLVRSNKIPDETEAVKYCAPLNQNIILIPGGTLWPNTVINRAVTNGATTVFETIDPSLNDRGLPPYPPLQNASDPSRFEEIRRTVYVSNISSYVSLDNLNDLFGQVGEVRFIRFAGDENSETKSAYIEFSEQPHVIKALCLNGLLFASKHLKVNHATNAIVKPATNKQIFACREKSPKRRSSSVNRSSPNNSKHTKKRSSRSPHRRSRSRKRSRSKKRSKSPRKRSRSSKKRSHERKKRRSSSKSKKRSRSRDHKNSHSKETKKRKSRSKSKTMDGSNNSKTDKSTRHR